MHEMVRQSWMRFNEPLEGIVNFMYLDVKGWVSTGMGNKIDEDRAAELGTVGSGASGILAAGQSAELVRPEHPAQPLHQPAWRPPGTR